MIPPVRHEVVDGLRKEVYTYWLNEGSMCLVLDFYQCMERTSRRHKWQTVARWDRLFRRERNMMRHEDVPQLSSDVRAGILRKFVEQITIE